MILPILKTLSLSFVTLAAVAPSSDSGEQLALHLSSKSIEAPARGTPGEVDQDWEYRLDLVVEPRDAHPIAPLSLRGAIIVPPFRAFVPYRRHGVARPEHSEARKTPLVKD